MKMKMKKLIIGQEMKFHLVCYKFNQIQFNKILWLVVPLKKGKLSRKEI